MRRPNAVLLAQMQGRLGRWMRQTADPLLAGPIASPFYRQAIYRINTLAGES